MRRPGVLIAACCALVTALVVAWLSWPGNRNDGSGARRPVAAPAPGQLGVYTGELTASQVGLLRSAGVDADGLGTSAGTGGKIHVEVVLTRGQYDTLRRQGIPLTPKQTAGTATVAAGAGTGTGAHLFHPYGGAGGIRDDLVKAAKDHPLLAKTETIGTTVRGADILAVKVTKGAATLPDGARPAVLYLGGQHAREWIAPELTRRLLHHVLDQYGKDPTITAVLDRTELWFIPVQNPDGYDFTFTPDHRLWRKNLRDNNGDGKITDVDGVDLNRNFDYKWGYDDEGASPDPREETYRGPAPDSEPETKALDALLARMRFAFLLNYHSAAQTVLYGTGWQVATPSPDDAIAAAMVGDRAHPAVPGWVPQQVSDLISASNGDTDSDAQTKYGTLAFAVELDSCQTVSGLDPKDSFKPEDCPSEFEFPDSEPLVAAEFGKGLPFALSLARSAPDPGHPITVTGRTVPDFQTDPFTVSYGDPQPVAVLARRSLAELTLHWQVDGGAERTAPADRWAGGKRYGQDGTTYFAEYRGTVTGVHKGQHVRVWFTGWPAAGPSPARRSPTSW